MLERRIFGEGEDRREIHIWHGANESMIIHDTDWPEEHDSWGRPLKKEDKKKFKWFSPDPYEDLEKEILGK